MTAEKLTFLEKEPRLEPVEDYALLRRQGLDRLEQLAHRVWTDYNVHDPGIALLELFAFAITELGYRGGHDIVDLLTELVDGVPVNGGDFHTARQVLTGAPVSFSDLRKLLVDVEGVKGAWIEPHREAWHLLDPDAVDPAAVDPDRAVKGRLVSRPAERIESTSVIELGGLYDVLVEYEDFVARPDPESEERPDRHFWTVGPSDDSAGGGFIDPSPGGRDKGLRFDVLYEITLDSVSVYAERDGEIEIRLRDRDGRLLESRLGEVRAGDASRVPLGLRIPPGQGYRLCAGPADDLPQRLHRTLASAADFPSYVLEPVIRLRGGDVHADRPIDGDASGIYYFFYDWRLAFFADPDTGDPGLPRAETISDLDVHAAVLDRLHTRRNLCQDLVCVRQLEIEDIAVCADIVLEPGADVDEALAEIFYRVESHISPPVRFYSLQEMQQRGKTTEEIFDGPRLLHGFIDDEQWQAQVRRCELRSSDIMRLILDVPGVVAVDRFSLLSFANAENPLQEPWVLPLATDRFLSPRLDTSCSKIILLKNDLPYFANRDEVARLLAEKRASTLPSKLRGAGEAELDLPVPAGTWRDVGAYRPMQDRLPANFTVGRVKVAASAPEERKAQSRQLRAFLMFFEQLLANHAAQLAHVGELFSWRGESTSSYFTQRVGGLRDAQDLYLEELSDLDMRLGQLIERPEDGASRRLRFLGHLASRFAEDLGPYRDLMRAFSSSGSAATLIGDLQHLLADMPRVGGERGQGHDVRHPAAAANLSGYRRRIYRLLGMRDLRRRLFAGRDLRIEALEDGGFRFVLDGESGVLLTSIVCEERSDIEALLDFALELSGDEAAWEPQDDPRELVLRCPDREPETIARLAPGADVDRVRERLADIAGAEGLHVIEHLLLRPRHPDGPFLPVQLDPACIPVRDPYSFRASVFIPAWPRRNQDVKFRRFVEDTVRAEAPAHVHLRICWISHDQMRHLEESLRSFEQALARLVIAQDGRCEEPPPEDLQEAHRSALGELIETLSGLVNVQPTARLHDCQTSQGDRPHITLGHTSLGTA